MASICFRQNLRKISFGHGERAFPELAVNSLMGIFFLLINTSFDRTYASSGLITETSTCTCEGNIKSHNGSYNNV